MKIEQLENKNQFVIYDDDHIYFQSYNSTVAKYRRKTSELILGKDWDYSQTTLKHLYIFLDRETDIQIPCNCKNKRAYIQKMIDDNKIKYDESL